MRAAGAVPSCHPAIRRVAEVRRADLGLAGAMQQLSSQMGAVLGSVIMTAVQTARESTGLVSSYRAAFMVSAAVAWGRRSRRCSCARPPSCQSEVIALISLAMACDASSVGIAVCSAIIFIMSPCTLILPPMKACIAAA
jgi:hypothetical protein